MIGKRRNSVFYKMLVSYTVLFAIPLLVLGGVFYYFNVVSLQRELPKTKLSQLTQVKNRIDLELKTLKEVVYHISSVKEIYSDLPGDRNMNSSLIGPQLQQYKNQYPFIDDILFYYRGDSKVYLASDNMSYNLFKNGIGRDYVWWRASFFTELNSVSAPRTKRIMTEKSVSGDKDNLLAFLFPVPYLQAFPQATIAILIDENKILSKFQNVFGEFEGSIYIYDQYYNSLVTVNNNMTNIDEGKFEKQLRTSKGTGVYDLTVNNMKLKVMRIVSDEMNWSYIIAMPDSYFYKRVDTMRRLIEGITLLLIVLGFIGAVVFSRNNYRPIKTLLSFFMDQENTGEDIKGKNELEIIRFTFEGALHQNKEMLLQMNAQRPFIRDQCLLTLLRGRKIDPGERDYLIKCSNMRLNGNAYCCMAISLQPDETRKHDLNSLVTLLEDVSFVGGRGFGVEIANEKHVVVVIVFQEQPIVGQEDIARNIVALAKKQLGLNINVGIGKVYPTLDHLSTSYLEAATILFDNQTNGQDAIHFFDDIDKVQEQINWYPIKEQALYMQALKHGDLTVALESLSALIHEITNRTTSYLMVRCLCFDIVNNILKAINQMDIQFAPDDIREVLKFNSLQEFHADMGAFTELFCSQVNHYKENKNMELKNSIITYINENFKDSNLSLGSIADRFQLSDSFLSRFIKDETGVNFMDYLTRLRMNEIKFQLQNTDKLIRDIITDVGYINTPSFIRKFKALEGVTPSQYRGIIGKN